MKQFDRQSGLDRFFLSVAQEPSRVVCSIFRKMPPIFFGFE